MALKKYLNILTYEFLFDQYITRSKSSSVISEFIYINFNIKIHKSQITRYCKYYNIPVRSSSDSILLKRERDFIDNKSVLYGTLLGDASLKGSASSAYFSKANKYREHLLFCCNYLIYDVASKIRLEHRKSNSLWPDGSKRKEQFIYCVYSLRSIECTNYHKLWYKNGKKIIPSDMFIDNVVLLHWFLDDGTLSKNPSGNGAAIIFCTDSFSKEENMKLCLLINEQYDLNANVIKYLSTTRIRIPNRNAKKFLSIIGDPPVTDLAYKWNIGIVK